ncbi:MAG TPA: hypothetical protein PLM98_03590 [Thiolinea sp.]|nr:hypothetical protein [Thiolinea sp.]
MKSKNLLAKLSLASCSLLAASSLLGAGVESKSSQEADSIKTSKTFNGFKVDISAPTSVDAQQLLGAIPEDLNYSANVFDKVSAAVDKVRTKSYPDASIALDVTRLGEKAASKTTSGYVSLYAVKTRWNKVVNYNGQVYSYNYYRNTAVCFGRVQSGSWYGQVQANGSWTDVGYVYAGGVQHMYSTGSDDYKGCNWWGKSSYNKGDFIMYFFD